MGTWKSIEDKRAYERKYYAENKEKRLAKGKKYYEKNKEKTLRRHKEWRENNPEKYKNIIDEWNKKHPEKVRGYQKKYIDANKEKLSERHHKWRTENPEKQKECYNNWASKNRDKIRVKDATRRAKKFNATPPWADLEEIKRIYKSAADMNLTVDHIIPLKNPNVCGLHIPHNLQLLTKSENSRKKNRFEQ